MMLDRGLPSEGYAGMSIELTGKNISTLLYHHFFLNFFLFKPTYCSDFVKQTY